MENHPSLKKRKLMSQEEESLHMTLEEILEEAAMCKSEGTRYFLNNKFKLALKYYKKIFYYLEDESEAEGENKMRKDTLVCAGHLNVAACYLKLEKFRDVIEHSEKALEIQPHNPKGHFRRGKAYLSLREYEKAKESFMRVLEYDPSNSAAKKMIFVCNINLKKQLEKEKKMCQNMFRNMTTERGKATTKGDGCTIAEASNHLGMNLYHLLAKEKTNVFFSPFCISSALAMLFCGTENETAEEMREVLGYKVANIKDEELKFCFQKLLNELDKDKKFYILNCANSVLSRTDFPVKEEYKLLLEDFFKASFMEVDFINESKKTVNLLNEWVSEKTNKMIPNLLDSFDPSTVMILLNAVYFKGSWEQPFNKRYTLPQYFYNKGDKNNCRYVDTMINFYSRFLYTKKESYKAIELPYKGDDISMMILLPDAKDGLSELENSLSSSFIQDIKQSMWSAKVYLTLPKFNLAYSECLKRSLQTMGLNRVFKVGAHLNGINDSNELFLSEVRHSAVLVVNEEGTEAAAVTGGLNGGGCGPVEEKHDFKVDHPFMFVIYNTKNNLILFMGRVDEL